MPKPLNEMAEYEWMTVFCAVCGELDAILREIETPEINLELDGRTVEREELARSTGACETGGPRNRNIGLFWQQLAHAVSRGKGKMKSKCWIGDKINTKPGKRFKIVAIARKEGHLRIGSRHPSIPSFRTKSAEVTVIRA